jgi:uncharacterized protein YceK
MKLLVILILLSGCSSTYKRCGYTEYRWGTVYTVEKGRTLQHECIR